MTSTVAAGAKTLATLSFLVLVCTGQPSMGADQANPVETNTDSGATPDPRQGDWCDTDAAWQRKAMQLYGARTSCSTGDPCDDPGVRDAHIPDASTPFQTIRLNIIVFAEDDGSNPAATHDDIQAQLVQMNTDFAPYRYRFVHTCSFVNESTYRLLSSVEVIAMTDAHAERPDIQCNVYVTDLSCFYGEGLSCKAILGIGTFPWDPDALETTGGLIVEGGAFGAGEKTMTHEMGHCLGLWHTHRGVSEFDGEPCFDDGDPCDCPCYERADGTDADTTGDFASDTPPTPINGTCDPPGGSDTCSAAPTPWGLTQTENYMGYGLDEWLSMFTEQQAGRMHCWTQDSLPSWVPGSTLAKLTAMDGTAPDVFGISVAVDHDVAAIGAAQDETGGYFSGSAYVYRFDGTNWVEEQDKLTASDATDYDGFAYFGLSIAVDGDTVVVGGALILDGDENGKLISVTGAVYIYQFNGTSWVEKRLTAPNPADFDYFGASVAIDGDTVVIGAPSCGFGAKPGLPTKLRLGVRLRAQRRGMDQTGRTHHLRTSHNV